MEELLEHWTKMQAQFPVLLGIAVNVVAAIAIFILGMIIARRLRKRLRSSSFDMGLVDPTLRPILASSAFYLVIAVTLYAVLTKIGVPATSLLAIFGAAGLAVGLALKDTLSNIASGVMLLVLRPLNIGEFIETPITSGSVKEVGLFATTLKNSEGIYIFVPNREIWKNRIKNFGRHTERKFVENINIGFENDLKKTQALILAILNETPDVLSIPSAPECYVTKFGDNGINISARCWLPADGWTKRSSDLRINLKEALDKAQVTLAYPPYVALSQNS